MAHTLLLADDSVTIQRVIELTFADEDVNVVAVSDGDQAIQRIEQSPPDIVLADIGMPGKSGYEVAQHVKHTPKLSHIPVVLLTGAFEPVDQAKAAEARCDGVLAKPFEPQMVIARVRELLGTKPAAATPPEDIHAQIDQIPNPTIDVHHQIEQATPTGGGHPQTPPSIEDYFDRLDAAFAKLGSAPPPAPTQTPPAPAAHQPQSIEPNRQTHHHEPAAMPEIDWFGAAASTSQSSTAQAPAAPATHPPEPQHVDAPVGYASPAPAMPSAPVATVPEQVEARAPEPPKPVAPAAQSKGLPPLEEAFAALLAAEQANIAVPNPPGWPATLPSAHDLAEQVARMVLEQLADREAVKHAVSEVVSQIAERMVREEIDRIKAAIR